MKEFDVDWLDELRFNAYKVDDWEWEGNHVLIVEPTHVIDTTRWSTVNRLTFQDLNEPTKFYRMQWFEAATEMQHEDFEPILTQVEPYEETVTRYRKVEDVQ